ncbi:MAG: DinB family protein [bacterium]
MASNAIANALIVECKRRLRDESLPRLKKCLSQLDDEEVWFRPNSETVSVGNLILHLCGNVRQWIIATLGEKPDVRERENEFLEAGPISKTELVQRLESTLQECLKVLNGLDPSTLLLERTVQGFQETGVSILVHVMEHFSYHVGQISYFTKSRKAVDLQFYRGADLNKTGS